jgi:hypothetical protein
VLAALAAVPAAAVSFTSPCHAQSSGRNPAAAQALYDDARQLVKAGKFAEACPKFKESYRLDPGGGTLLNLADCYEKQGATALAWTTFKEALAVAQRDGRNDRIEFANQHLTALDARLARLTVHVPDSARVPGMTVSLDGAPLGEAAWGVAMPVDPGSHVIRAEAPGKQPFSTSVDVPSKAGQQEVDVPKLADASGSAPAAGTSTAPAGTVPPAAETETKGSATATVGWIVGGAGVAAIGVGSYFGLHAISRWNDRQSQCKQGCTTSAKSAGDDANQAATISDVAFGVGAAALAVGVYLVLSSHGGKASAAHEAAALRIAPAAAPGGAGIAIGGDW